MFRLVSAASFLAIVFLVAGCGGKEDQKEVKPPEDFQKIRMPPKGGEKKPG